MNDHAGAEDDGLPPGALCRDGQWVEEDGWRVFVPDAFPRPARAAD